jgi:hypothetical protein
MLILFISLFLSVKVFSQQYINDIKVHQIQNEVQIVYELKGNYIGNQKIKSFNVVLFYSTDNGKTYQESKNAIGQVGEKIVSGRNKLIIWKPDNQYNSLVGEINYKIEAIPNKKKSSIGLSYYRGLFLKDPNLKWGFDELKLFLYEPRQLKGGSTFIYIGYSHYVTTNFVGQDLKYETNNLFTAGIGTQTDKRGFSIYLGGGIGSFTYDDNYEGQNKTTAGSLAMGMIIKLIDTNMITVGLPIEIGAFIGHGYAYLSTGISLQF